MGIKDSESPPPEIEPESEQAYKIRAQRAEWKRGMSFLAEAQRIMVEAEVKRIEEERKLRDLFEVSPYKIRHWKSEDEATGEEAEVTARPIDITDRNKTVEVSA